MTRRYCTYWYGGMGSPLQKELVRYWTRRIVRASDQCFSRP